VDQIIQLIQERTNFVITGHTSPDEDAIGSCYGLAFALYEMGKNVTVVLEPYPQKYNFIPGIQFLYAGNLSDLEVDVLIALDCADESRLGLGQSLFARAKYTVCIDHHKTNTGFAQFNYIEPETASTSEIVFRLINKLISPTAEIAAAIYAGIVGDTGGFKYDSTNRSTMEIAATLMETGIPFTKIYGDIMHQHSFAAAKALGLILQNAISVLGGRIMYSFISCEMRESIGASLADLDGAVEYLVNTTGTDVAALIYEKAAPHVKISLRSHGADVGSVAAALGGGGHQMAAGATVLGNIEATIEKLLHLLEKELIDYDRRT